MCHQMIQKAQTAIIISLALAAPVAIAQVPTPGAQTPLNMTQNAPSPDGLSGQATNTGSNPAGKGGNPVQLPPLPDPIVNQVLPLTPDQIRQLRKQQDEVRRAAAEPPRAAAKPSIRLMNVDLSPGSVPPVARITVGFGTGLAFIDQTGAPWPIAAVDLANKDDFKANLAVPGTNVVTINALSSYGNGNMLVFLKDFSTPVAVTLLSGQPNSDYRLDLRVPYSGPNARPDMTPKSIAVKFNRALVDVLDGISPQGSKPVTVNGQHGMAWRDGNKLLLRTTASVMSPAPIQSTSSQDGTRVFELEYTPSVLIALDGKLINLKIGD